jgi:hypothetical protein
VHDPSRQQREQSGDDQRAGEKQDHDAAVVGDLVTMRPPYAERKRDQREDRQQMDRAPGSDQLLDRFI